MKKRLLSLALLFAAPACTTEDAVSTDVPIPTEKRVTFVEKNPNVVALSGAAFDPEAFFFSLGHCPQPCPELPVAFPNFTFYERSVVAGANVMLLDGADPTAPPLTARAPTNDKGFFDIVRIPSRKDVPFLLMAAAAPGAGTLKAVGTGLPPVPAGNYIPTVTLLPIFTGKSTYCTARTASMVSDAGILSAIAKYKTQTGTATTVADLIDPTKYGGVGIFWLHHPTARVPAFGALIGASAGEVLHLAWAPPNFPGLPPQITDIQSPRGYYVDGSSPSSPLGLSAILLPAASAGTPISITFTDPVTDASQQRPYSFLTLPPMALPPGVIAYADIPASTAGVPSPPRWACAQ